MKTLNDLKTELTETGYEYSITQLFENEFMFSVTYTKGFSVTSPYNIMGFTTIPLLSNDGEKSFIAFTVKF